MLSLRLQSVASFIPENSQIINVGTDHALLEIFLAKTKNVKSIGVDIRSTAVLRAKHNVIKEKLEHSISIFQNDGLKNLETNNKIIVLSGLGTKTILEVLDGYNASNIIIQSNNSLYKLRKAMHQKGYYIFNEKAIYDKKWYVIIQFKKGNQLYSDFDYYVGPKIKNQDYINHLIKINTKLLKSIPEEDRERKFKIESLISKLKKL